MLKFNFKLKIIKQMPIYCLDTFRQAGSQNMSQFVLYYSHLPQALAQAQISTHISYYLFIIESTL